MFSSRFHWDHSPNDLTQLLERKRAKGETLLDLTSSNPTNVGLLFSSQHILHAFSSQVAQAYDPHPRGMLAARKAIGAYYLERGDLIPPESIHLTASTSEAYSFLFKLLTDPGDDVLVPRPSYPLFEFLAAMENIRTSHYDLVNDSSSWRIDFDSVIDRWTDRTRAVLLVHPNNPTGSYASGDELLHLMELCAERNVALIMDEVFFDYRLMHNQPPSATAPEPHGLTFILNGLSKLLAQPHLKLGWIVTRGPKALVQTSLEHLDLVTDTYLSVNSPVQHALPELLGLRKEIQSVLQERLASNLSVLRNTMNTSAVRALPVEGGWASVLDTGDRDEEELALVLLERDNVLVHPGYFFNMDENHLVVSLLQDGTVFRMGAERIAARAET